ncbi:hypothetical protein ON010_g13613 [Phytophthora cinnamomi]|nr:hypothetical protein ON010_g13613 [Phytophthora cinnamomi]
MLLCCNDAALADARGGRPSAAAVHRHPRVPGGDAPGEAAAAQRPVRARPGAQLATENVPEEQRAAKKQEWSRFWIERGFEAFEKELAKTAGAYCFGDEVTLADLYLQPQIYNANRVGVDMTKYPTIVRISAALETVPAFQKAHPSQQPDAVN